MKKVLILSAMLAIPVCVAAIFLFTFKKAASEMPCPIRISLNSWVGYAHAYIAQDKGFFEKNGVEVELVPTCEYSDSQRLFVNGEVDGAFQVLTDTIMQNSVGIDSAAVYICDYSVDADVVVAKQGIASMADLKGKTIGIEELNGFSEYFVLKLLEKEGLSELDVRFSLVPAQQIADALAMGEIDAGHTWEPETSEAIEQGFAIIGKAGDLPGSITDVLALKKEVLKSRPREVKAIVESMLEARNYIYSNRDEAVAIIAAHLGWDSHSINQALDGILLLNQRENMDAMDGPLHAEAEHIIEFYSKRGQIGIPVAAGEMIDSRFLSGKEGLDSIETGE